MAEFNGLRIGLVDRDCHILPPVAEFRRVEQRPHEILDGFVAIADFVEVRLRRRQLFGVGSRLSVCRYNSPTSYVVVGDRLAGVA